MTDIILLDTGPLGLVTHPRGSAESDECNQWLRSQLAKGTRVLVPGISDYELRREMLLTGSTRGVAKLDELKQVLGFDPVTTAVLDQAAAFWAQARQMGQPTAKDAALDGDMILSAHAAMISSHGYTVVVATTNVKHLALFTDAQLWRDIT